MEKKNIDRLFQEKFKDFEAHPSDKVWERLSQREKKKRSILVPLWFKLGSAAAIILLLLWLGNSIIDKNASSPLVNENPILKEQNAGESKQTEIVEDNAEKPAQNEDLLTPQSKNRFRTDENENNKSITGNKKGSNSSIATENSESKAANKGRKSTFSGEKSVVASENQPANRNKRSEKLSENLKNQAVTQNQNASGMKPDDKTSNTEGFAFAEADSTEIVQENAEESISEESLLEQLEKEKNSEVAAVEPDQKESKRWGVSPRIAPVYYGSFSGSGIDPQFSDNNKDGEVNMSYGLQISYAVNDRLKIRSGVNKVNLSYNTDNIGFSSELNAKSLRSVNYTKESGLIEVSDASTSSYLAAPSNAEIQTNSLNGKLSQDLGYYEVPVEVEYALINKKIGLQVIGGVSTLFLSDNKILLEDGNYSTTLGTSNSLNNVSFSTNVGLGVDYNLSEKLQFNLEPMFKYQLNSYKNSVSDFKPYYLGLYTGVSFKF